MATAVPTAPAKKTTVPKDVIARLAKGDEPITKKPDPAAAGAATAAKADDKVKPAEGAAAAAPAAGAPAETTAGVKKKVKSTLPAIPPAGSAPAAESSPATVADVRQALAESRAPGAAAAGAAPTLRPEDQQDLELAKFAASQHPDRYAELPTRITEFFTKRDEFITKKSAELGGQNTPEFRDFLKGDEFRDFVSQNAPSYQRGDSKKIYEEFIEHRGAQRALRAIEPEMAKIRKKQEETEKAPVINQIVRGGIQEMLTDPETNKDPALADFVKSPTDFVKGNEIEGEIISSTASFFAEAMQETLRFTNGLSEMGEGGRPTPTQVWIDRFITSKEAEVEKRYPDGVQMPDGKILVAESQMKRLKAAKVPNLSEYRCVLPAEIVGMIAIEGRHEIKRKLADARARLERSGFKRVAVGAAAAETGTKTSNGSSPASPMAGSSAARGAGGGAVAGKPAKWFEQWTKG